VRQVWYVEHGQSAGWGIVWAQLSDVPQCETVTELRRQVARWRAESENWAVNLKVRSKIIYEEE